MDNLKGFTLGLPVEHYWPEKDYGNSVESWMGVLDNDWIVTVFCGDYSSRVQKDAKFYVTIRTNPNPEGWRHPDWFAAASRKQAFWEYFNDIDPLMLKCICLAFTSKGNPYV